MRRCALLLACAMVSALPCVRQAAAQAERVDLALVLAIDVSESIDAARFALQMQGIAAAFESREVQAAVLSGPHRAMLIAVVQWSNKPHVSLPWTLLTTADEVREFAARVRRLRRAEAGFTCMATALRSVADKVMTQLPLAAERRVVDVSGDGHDNCNPLQPVSRVRDELAADGVTVNGLPILEGDEADTLEGWYRDNVVGGPAAFLVPAAGFADFERAIRRKFLTEISAAGCGACAQQAAR